MFSSRPWMAANRDASPLPGCTTCGLHHLHQISMITAGCSHELCARLIWMGCIRLMKTNSEREGHAIQDSTGTLTDCILPRPLLSNLCRSKRGKADLGRIIPRPARPRATAPWRETKYLGTVVCGPGAPLCGPSGASHRRGVCFTRHDSRPRCPIIPMLLLLPLPIRHELAVALRADQSSVQTRPFGPVCCNRPAPREGFLNSDWHQGDQRLSWQTRRASFLEDAAGIVA